MHICGRAGPKSLPHPLKLPVRFVLALGSPVSSHPTSTCVWPIGRSRKDNGTVFIPRPPMPPFCSEFAASIASLLNCSRFGEQGKAKLCVCVFICSLLDTVSHRVATRVDRLFVYRGSRALGLTVLLEIIETQGS